MKKLWILMTLTGLPLMGWPQTEIEMMEQTDVEYAEEWMEEMEEWRVHPLDINKANLGTLRKMPLLSGIAAQIIEDRNNLGPYASWADFIRRNQLDPQLWEKWREFFTIRINPRRRIRVELRSRTDTDFTPAEEFRKGTFRGSPEKQNHKLRIEAPDIHSALAIEKDPGERGVDHCIGTIHWQFSPTWELVAGSFHLESGQGLVLWNPSGFWPALNPSSAIRRPRGIHPYAGASESGYMTGIAVQRLGPIQLCLAAASTPLDAVVSEEGTITSLPSSGLHRTKTELKHKDWTTEHLISISAHRCMSRTTVGFSMYQNHYKTEHRSSPPSPGSSQTAFGLDFQHTHGPFQIAGELAGSMTGWGSVLTASFALHPVEMMFAFWYITPGFKHPHGNCPYTSTLENRTGNCGGILWKTKWGRVRLRWEQTDRIQASSYIPIPAEGGEWQMEAEIGKGNRKLQILTSWDRNVRLVRGTTDSGIAAQAVMDMTRLDFRIEGRWKTGKMQIQGRIHTVLLETPHYNGDFHLKGSRESGILALLDIKYSLPNKLVLCIRCTSYRTDSYDSRITTVESGLPGAAQMCGCYGQGIRISFVCSHHWNPVMQWSFRAGENRELSVSSMPWIRDRWLQIQLDLRMSRDLLSSF